MRILVDAHATNRVKLVEKIAMKHQTPVILFCDDKRELYPSYASVVRSTAAPNAADMTLLNQCRKGDIVVTNNYGLAGIALAKGARVIRNSGEILDNRRIDMLLHYRAVKQMIRRNTKHFSQCRKVDFGEKRQQHGDFYDNLKRLITTPENDF